MELVHDVTTPEPPLLEAVGLSKRYEDGGLALDHVGFEVAPGTVYAMGRERPFHLE